jgi:toxin YoeB
MTVKFTQHAWQDYTYWQVMDKSVVKKINLFIKEIGRTPYEGTGKPEPLKYDLSGFWSRRINSEHRLIYQVLMDEILIISCRYHYD